MWLKEGPFNGKLLIYEIQILKKSRKCGRNVIFVQSSNLHTDKCENQHFYSESIVK